VKTHGGFSGRDGRSIPGVIVCENTMLSSLRAKRSNPEAASKNWIASSQGLLAMTEVSGDLRSFVKPFAVSQAMTAVV
jgi:hypothetical protein